MSAIPANSSGTATTALGLSPPGPTQQWIRKCTLLVSNAAGEAIDLSNLRIKFQVKRSSTQTPNAADIRVYNVASETAAFIKKEFTTVILQAGYQGNFGIIHKGNIKQVIVGRESATDTFVDIISGDGDQAYNFASLNQSFSAGSTTSDHLNVAIQSMNAYGVTPGYVGAIVSAPLPRGKTMFGSAKDQIRQIANSTGFGWSMQNEQIQFIKQTTYLPGTAVVLTSKTGMIGTPQQTNQGVNVKCLLNPFLQVNGRVNINNASIAAYKIDLSVPNSPANIPPPTNADGIYFILVVEHSGDTRGVEWYSNLITLNIDVTSNPLNAITIGAGNG